MIWGTASIELYFSGRSSIFKNSHRLIKCFELGGFALKEQKESKGSKILWVKDEKEFYSLIEERMVKQGFEVLETSLVLRRESDSVRFH